MRYQKSLLFFFRVITIDSGLENTFDESRWTQRIMNYFLHEINWQKKRDEKCSNWIQRVLLLHLPQGRKLLGEKEIALHELKIPRGDLKPG